MNHVAPGLRRGRAPAPCPVLAALSLAAVLAACSSDTRGRPAPPERPATGADDPSRPLWELAPEGTKAAIVVPPGSVPRVLDAFRSFADGYRNVSPVLVPGLARLEQLRRWSDPLELTRAGLDATAGFAMFVDGSSELLLLVLPISDPSRFASGVKAALVTHAGRPGMQLATGPICTPVDDTYWACAKATALAGVRRDPKSTVAAARPAELRGDVQLHADLQGFGRAARAAAILGLAVADPGALWASVVLDPGAPSFHARVEGARPGSLAPALRANPIAAWEREAMRGASGVLRGELPLSLLRRQASLWRARTPLPAWRGVLDEPMGTPLLVARGQGFLAGEIRVPFPDSDAAGRALARLCAGATGPDCRTTTVDGFFRVVSRASTDHHGLVVQLGGVTPPVGEPFDELAGSAGTRAILTEPAGLVWWSRTLAGAEVGPELARLGQRLPDGSEAGLSVFASAGDRVYDVAASLTVVGQTLHLRAAATTMAGDPPAAREAYAAAQALAPERDRWLEALAALERAHPESLVARRAAERRRGAPIIGPALLLAVWLGGP